MDKMIKICENLVSFVPSVGYSLLNHKIAQLQDTTQTAINYALVKN